MYATSINKPPMTTFTLFPSPSLLGKSLQKILRSPSDPREWLSHEMEGLSIWESPTCRYLHCPCDHPKLSVTWLTKKLRLHSTPASWGCFLLQHSCPLHHYLFVASQERSCMFTYPEQTTRWVCLQPNGPIPLRYYNTLVFCLFFPSFTMVSTLNTRKPSFSF